MSMSIPDPLAERNCPLEELSGHSIPFWERLHMLFECGLTIGTETIRRKVEYGIKPAFCQVGLCERHKPFIFNRLHISCKPYDTAVSTCIFSPVLLMFFHCIKFPSRTVKYMNPPVATLQPHTELGLESKAIREQLESMLTSHFFCNSSRYPALLRYLVEQSLAGNGAGLKERLLGIEVFHRQPDYDTNADPVVRVTAAEVRKRLAQYYQEAEHAGEIRVELPLGSYVPRFYPPRTLPSAAETPGLDHGPGLLHLAESLSHDADHDVSVQTRRSVPWDRKGMWRLGLGVLLGVVLMILIYAATMGLADRRDRAVKNLWAPLAGGRSRILVVVGNHSLDKDGKALKPQDTHPNPSDAVIAQMNHNSQVTITDLLSFDKVVGYLVRNNLAYRSVGGGVANLEDLRGGPVVLFAGLDNPWTMRLTDQLRYRFVRTQDDTVGTIEDTKDTSRRWSVNFNLSYSQLPMDYAIVARFQDPLVEQPILIAAGIGEMGTAAASEFVSQNRFMEEVARLAPDKNWRTVNVELVIATSVIDGHPGPPHVLAEEFW